MLQWLRIKPNTLWQISHLGAFIRNKIKKENSTRFVGGQAGGKFSSHPEKYLLASASMAAKMDAYAAASQDREVPLQGNKALQANRNCCVCLCGAGSRNIKAQHSRRTKTGRGDGLSFGITMASARSILTSCKILAGSRNLRRC